LTNVVIIYPLTIDIIGENIGTASAYTKCMIIGAINNNNIRLRELIRVFGLLKTLKVIRYMY